jgi:hypothetical protein
MSKQRKKSAKNTKMQGEEINESRFLPDDGSLQKQQDEHNRLFDQEKTLAAVSSWMEENLPDDEMEDEDTPQDDDPNQREIVTEEDDLRAGAIRRLKVHHLFKGRQDQTQE